MPELLPLWIQVHEGPTHPLAPQEFQLPQAELPRCAVLVPGWEPDLLAPAPVLASSPEERHDALAAAAIAHLAGPWSRTDDGDAVRCDLTTLRRSGCPVLDPASVITVDQAIAADPRSPLLPLASEPVMWWVPAHRLSDDHPQWVPLAAVHTGPVPRLCGSSVGDPRAAPVGAVNLVGLAGGRTRSEAVRTATGHVVAHHVVATWWADPTAAPPVLWHREDPHTTLLWLPGPHGVPAILAVVDDPVAQITCVGVDVDADPERAARRAAALAWHQATLLADLALADGVLRRTAPGWGGATLLPWRSDRMMLDEAPAVDVAGATVRPRPALGDPLLALQCGLDPRLRAALRQRLTPACTAPPPSVDPVAVLADQLWVRDLTPALSAHHGWTAVRVLWPGAARLDPPALPCRQLTAAPTQLPWPGW